MALEYTYWLPYVETYIIILKVHAKLENFV
jgi:hypothetical protein